MKPGKTKQMSIFIIVFFQFFGAFLFGYMNFISLNYYPDIEATQGSPLMFYSNFFFALFMVLSYGRQFSGGIYNCAVVFFRQIRRTDRLSVKIGLLYQASQILGAMVGCVIAAYTWDLKTTAIPTLISGGEQFKRFCSEAFGGFILTFMVQYIVDKRMTFIQHNRDAFICIPLIFMIARGYSRFSNVINPAFGFAFQFAFAVKSKTWAPIQMAYILFFGPYAGALFACLAFQFILKPLYPYKKQQIQNMLEKILKDNQKKLRVSKIKQSQIQAYRQNYKKQALKYGIQIDSQDDETQKQSLIESQSQNGNPNDRQITQFQTDSQVNSQIRSQKQKKKKRRNSKVGNRRWTLAQVLTHEPMKAPLKQFQQKFFKRRLSIIDQQQPVIQYMNDDIESIQDEEEAPLVIKKRQSKIDLSNRGSQESRFRPSLVIKSIYEKFQRRQSKQQKKLNLNELQELSHRRSLVDPHEFRGHQLVRQTPYEKSISIKQEQQFAPRVQIEGEDYQKKQKKLKEDKDDKWQP